MRTYFPDVRFRPARGSDISAAVALVKGDGGFRTPEHYWDALPGIWTALLADGATGIVWEDLENPAVPMVAFGLAAFIAPELLDEWRAAPSPWFAQLVCERYLAGRPAWLNPRQLAEGCTGSGLDLVVLHFALRHRSLAHPVTQRYLPVGASAWYYSFAGYNLRSIRFEVFGPEHGAFMEAGGYRLEHEFAGPNCHQVPADLTPRMYIMARDDMPPGAMDAAALTLFHSPAPRFGFSPSEQRLLLRALLGESDRQVSQGLGVSDETIKKGWQSIYHRIGMVNDRILGPQAVSGSPGRGPEKRRVVLEYLRQHMEELRPRR